MLRAKKPTVSSRFRVSPDGRATVHDGAWVFVDAGGRVLSTVRPGIARGGGCSAYRAASNRAVEGRDRHASGRYAYALVRIGRARRMRVVARGCEGRRGRYGRSSPGCGREIAVCDKRRVGTAGRELGDVRVRQTRLRGISCSRCDAQERQEGGVNVGKVGGRCTARLAHGSPPQEHRSEGSRMG